MLHPPVQPQPGASGSQPSTQYLATSCTHRLGWVPVFTPHQGSPGYPQVGSPGLQIPFSPQPFSLGRRCPSAASALCTSHCHPALRQRQLPVQPQLQGHPGGVRKGPSASPGLSQVALTPWAVALCQWDSSGHDGWVPRAVQSSTPVQHEGPQQPGWLMAWAPLPPSLPRGKFGEVHTCTEKETGLKLAAKVIRKQGAKDKV